MKKSALILNYITQVIIVGLLLINQTIPKLFIFTLLFVADLFLLLLTTRYVGKHRFGNYHRYNYMYIIVTLITIILVILEGEGELYGIITKGLLFLAVLGLLLAGNYKEPKLKKKKKSIKVKKDDYIVLEAPKPHKETTKAVTKKSTAKKVTKNKTAKKIAKKKVTKKPITKTVSKKTTSKKSATKTANKTTKKKTSKK